MPSTTEEWNAIATDFQSMWQFPHCCGALDGKHIRINPPKESGSYYYNYKGFNSIVLMALVSANYEFLFVDIGCNGRVSDGGVLANTELGKQILSNTLALPEDSPISTNDKTFPFVFVADDAFSLRTNMMKPFPQKQLTTTKQIFNYRLSRARRTVENAFGILANRFRLFLTSINLVPAKVEVIVLATCALHNYLRRHSRSTYTPPGFVDDENIEKGVFFWSMETRTIRITPTN